MTNKEDDDFMLMERAKTVLDDKRKARILSKKQRIQQIIDEAVLQQEKEALDSMCDDEDNISDVRFDVTINVKEMDVIKETIQKKDLDIFDFKFLVENLDNIDASIDFFRLKERRIEEEEEQEFENQKKR